MTVEAQRAAPSTDGIKSTCGNGENRSLYLQPPYMQYRLPEAQHAAPLHTLGLNCPLSIVNCQLSIDKLLPPNENARRCLPGNATPATPSLAGNPLPAKEQKPVADLAGAALPKPPELC